MVDGKSGRNALAKNVLKRSIWPHCSGAKVRTVYAIVRGRLTRRSSSEGDTGLESRGVVLGGSGMIEASLLPPSTSLVRGQS